MTLTLTAEIDVIPQKRPRFSRKTGKAYDDSVSRKFKADLRLIMAAQWRGRSPIEGAEKVRLKVWRNFESPMHSQFGDSDNLVKGIFDAVKGLLWLDDRQVVKVEVEKLTAPIPHLEMTIEEAV